MGGLNLAFVLEAACELPKHKVSAANVVAGPFWDTIRPWASLLMLVV